MEQGSCVDNEDALFCFDPFELALNPKYQAQQTPYPILTPYSEIYPWKQADSTIQNLVACWARAKVPRCQCPSQQQLPAAIPL
jgi:hypothetical protein